MKLTERDKWIASVVENDMLRRGEPTSRDWLAENAPSPWKSVDDELPEICATVLVDGGIAQYRGEYIGWYSLTGVEWPGRPIHWDVTHWMPLPKLPEGE